MKMSLENMIQGAYKDIEKTVVIPDMHCPAEDYRALHGIYEFIKDYKPHHVKLMGDVVDFYALSRFDKDPNRLLSLQEEIDVAQYHFEQLRRVHKGSITMLEGNHEDRLLRYLKANPEISSLKRVNNIPAILELDQWDIAYKKEENFHGLLLKHGNVVRRHSGYTARGEFENEGTSGLSGHTHRLAAHYVTNRSGQHAWYEMGHVCDESQADYINGVANWQKGFGLIEYDKKRRIWRVSQIPIIKNSFLVNGKTYSWHNRKVYKERELLK